MHIEAPRRSRTLIGLTPLIDVVFILLLFFMLASSFAKWNALELDAARASASGHGLRGAVLVRASASGAVDLNGESLGLRELGARVREMVERDAALRVVVRPAESLPLQGLVRVLDTLRAAGASSISLSRD